MGADFNPGVGGGHGGGPNGDPGDPGDPGDTPGLPPGGGPGGGRGCLNFNVLRCGNDVLVVANTSPEEVVKGRKKIAKAIKTDIRDERGGSGVKKGIILKIRFARYGSG